MLRATAVASVAALLPGAAARTAGIAAAVLAVRVQAAPARAGSAGIGDPYYPTYGNGGYDVTNYDVRVGYTPRTDRLTGRTTVTATATQKLRSFHLDLALKVSSVTVDGVRAKVAHTGRELVVTPRRTVAKGHVMHVVVTYAGTPSTVSVRGLSPWVRTKDGAVAVGEPEIAAWWFPSNDHPRDKATYSIRVTVPKGVEALSNGKKVSTKTASGRTTWHWRESRPMASYLAFFAAGQFDVTTREAAGGLPAMVTAVASDGGAAGRYAKADLKQTPAVLTWLSKQWGRYPFDAIGGVAPAASFGFALENQTRPVYTRDFWSEGSNIYVIVHEQAHQWFGDSVSVDRWRDIWLNEGFASFSEWLYSEQHGDGTAQQIFDATYAVHPSSDPFWRLAVGDPGKGHEFDAAVYDRGAMTLQALRNRIGDKAFTTVMRTWAKDRRYGNGRVSQFKALAEQVSHQQLDAFFDVWLMQTTKPAVTVANGFPAPARSARSHGPVAGVRSPGAVTVDASTLRATLARMQHVHDVAGGRS
ncbi:M1 family metallopeptidase [Angustibacter aerolatus]